MVGITAEGYGWDFVWQNFQFFMAQSKLWYIFPVLMLLVLFARKKEYRLLGIYPYLTFLVTVCNPFLIEIAGKLIGLSDRYYRFFWLIPLGLLAGILTAWIVGKIKWKVVQGVFLAAVAAGVVIFGSPAYFSEGAHGYGVRKNDFYITDVVLHVSEEFHKHGIKNPKVAYPDWMVYEICQYDPSIISIFAREEIPGLFPGSTDQLVNAVTEKNYELIVKYTYLTTWTDLVSPEQFHEAIKAMDMDYFVIPEEDERVLEFYKASGCELSGQTDGFYIMHVL